MTAAAGGAGAGALPAYLVRGDDEVLVREAVTALVRDLVGDADASLAVEDFDGDEYEVGGVVDAARTPPFLVERRVVVARQLGRFRTDELAPLLAYLADPSPTTSLVLVAGGGQLAKAVGDAVRHVGHVVEAGLPAGRGREKWLADRLKEAPVRFDGAATALLSGHLGEDVARLNGLLQTLEAAYGHGARLTPDDLEPFLGEAGATAPWDLTDAIDRGDTEAALEHLHRLIGAGERHALVVLATLHTHYARMLRLDGADVGSEQDAAALLGMRGSTFPAKKALTQARRLGSERIARAITLLADADLDLKGARQWPDELVLEVLVARLSRLAPRRSPARAGR